MSKPDLSILSTPALLRIYNAGAAALRRPGVTEFLNRELAIARVELMLRSAPIGMVVAENSLGVAILPFRVRHLAGDGRVIVRRVACPKLENTLTERRWELIKDGMTIAQFVDAVGDRRQAILYVRWNVRRQYLSLLTYVRDERP